MATTDLRGDKSTASLQGLRNRVLKVTLKMPGGDVVLDESLDIHVRARKAALSLQNKCTVEIGGLAGSVREQLLSYFTAWRKNQRDTNGTPLPYVAMQIDAGYTDSKGTSTVTTVFRGEIVLCELASPPPNVRVRITAFTRQTDKTKWITQRMPDNMTFRSLVFWAGNQMGFDDDHIRMKTSYDDKVIRNPAQSISNVAALIPTIQDFYHPDVAAFVDDDFLTVVDRNKAFNPEDQSVTSQFIGMPCWTEWGVEFTTLLTPAIRLATAAQVISTMNPSLNGTYVVMSLEYELTSRDTPFYLKVEALPSAI